MKEQFLGIHNYYTSNKSSILFNNLAISRSINLSGLRFGSSEDQMTIILRGNMSFEEKMEQIRSITGNDPRAVLDRQTLDALASGKDVAVHIEKNTERRNLLIGLGSFAAMLIGGIAGASYNKELAEAVSDRVKGDVDFVKRNPHWDMNPFGGATATRYNISATPIDEPNVSTPTEPNRRFDQLIIENINRQQREMAVRQGLEADINPLRQAQNYGGRFNERMHASQVSVYNLTEQDFADTENGNATRDAVLNYTQRQISQIDNLLSNRNNILTQNFNQNREQLRSMGINSLEEYRDYLQGRKSSLENLRNAAQNRQSGNIELSVEDAFQINMIRTFGASTFRQLSTGEEEGDAYVASFSDDLLEGSRWASLTSTQRTAVTQFFTANMQMADAAGLFDRFEQMDPNSTLSLNFGTSTNRDMRNVRLSEVQEAINLLRTNPSALSNRQLLILANVAERGLEEGGYTRRLGNVDDGFWGAQHMTNMQAALSDRMQMMGDGARALNRFTRGESLTDQERQVALDVYNMANPNAIITDLSQATTDGINNTFDFAQNQIQGIVDAVNGTQGGMFGRFNTVLQDNLRNAPGVIDQIGNAQRVFNLNASGNTMDVNDDMRNFSTVVSNMVNFNRTGQGLTADQIQRAIATYNSANPNAQITDLSQMTEEGINNVYSSISSSSSASSIAQSANSFTSQLQGDVTISEATKDNLTTNFTEGLADQLRANLISASNQDIQTVAMALASANGNIEQARANLSNNPNALALLNSIVSKNNSDLINNFQAVGNLFNRLNQVTSTQPSTVTTTSTSTTLNLNQTETQNLQNTLVEGLKNQFKDAGINISNNEDIRKIAMALADSGSIEAAIAALGPESKEGKLLASIQSNPNKDSLIENLKAVGSVFKSLQSLGNSSQTQSTLSVSENNMQEVENTLLGGLENQFQAVGINNVGNEQIKAIAIALASNGGDISKAIQSLRDSNQLQAASLLENLQKNQNAQGTKNTQSLIQNLQNAGSIFNNFETNRKTTLTTSNTSGVGNTVSGDGRTNREIVSSNLARAEDMISRLKGKESEYNLSTAQSLADGISQIENQLKEVYGVTDISQLPQEVRDRFNKLKEEANSIIRKIEQANNGTQVVRNNIDAVNQARQNQPLLVAKSKSDFSENTQKDIDILQSKTSSDQEKEQALQRIVNRNFQEAVKAIEFLKTNNPTKNNSNTFFDNGNKVLDLLNNLSKANPNDNNIKMLQNIQKALNSRNFSVEGDDAIKKIIEQGGDNAKFALDFLVNSGKGKQIFSLLNNEALKNDKALNLLSSFINDNNKLAISSTSELTINKLLNTGKQDVVAKMVENGNVNAMNLLVNNAKEGNAKAINELGKLAAKGNEDALDTIATISKDNKNSRNTQAMEILSNLSSGKLGNLDVKNNISSKASNKLVEMANSGNELATSKILNLLADPNKNKSLIDSLASTGNKSLIDKISKEAKTNDNVLVALNQIANKSNNTIAKTALTNVLKDDVLKTKSLDTLSKLASSGNDKALNLIVEKARGGDINAVNKLSELTQSDNSEIADNASEELINIALDTNNTANTLAKEKVKEAIGSGNLAMVSKLLNKNPNDIVKLVDNATLTKLNNLANTSTNNQVKENATKLIGKIANNTQDNTLKTNAINSLATLGKQDNNIGKIASQELVKLANDGNEDATQKVMDLLADSANNKSIVDAVATNANQNLINKVSEKAKTSETLLQALGAISAKGNTFATENLSQISQTNAKAIDLLIQNAKKGDLNSLKELSKIAISGSSDAKKALDAILDISKNANTNKSKKEAIGILADISKGKIDNKSIDQNIVNEATKQLVKLANDGNEDATQKVMDLLADSANNKSIVDAVATNANQNLINKVSEKAKTSETLLQALGAISAKGNTFATENLRKSSDSGNRIALNQIVKNARDGNADSIKELTKLAANGNQKALETILDISENSQNSQAKELAINALGDLSQDTLEDNTNINKEVSKKASDKLVQISNTGNTIANNKLSDLLSKNKVSNSLVNSLANKANDSLISKIIDKAKTDDNTLISLNKIANNGSTKAKEGLSKILTDDFLKNKSPDTLFKLANDGNQKVFNFIEMKARTNDTDSIKNLSKLAASGNIKALDTLIDIAENSKDSNLKKQSINLLSDISKGKVENIDVNNDNITQKAMDSLLDIAINDTDSSSKEEANKLINSIIIGDNSKAKEILVNSLLKSNNDTANKILNDNIDNLLNVDAKTKENIVSTLAVTNTLTSNNILKNNINKILSDTNVNKNNIVKSLLKANTETSNNILKDNIGSILDDQNISKDDLVNLVETLSNANTETGNSVLKDNITKIMLNSKIANDSASKDSITKSLLKADTNTTNNILQGNISLFRESLSKIALDKNNSSKDRALQTIVDNAKKGYKDSVRELANIVASSDDNDISSKALEGLNEVLKNGNDESKDEALNVLAELTTGQITIKKDNAIQNIEVKNKSISDKALQSLVNIATNNSIFANQEDKKLTSKAQGIINDLFQGKVNRLNLNTSNNTISQVKTNIDSKAIDNLKTNLVNKLSSVDNALSNKIIKDNANNLTQSNLVSLYKSKNTELSSFAKTKLDSNVTNLNSTNATNNDVDNLVSTSTNTNNQQTITKLKDIVNNNADSNVRKKALEELVKLTENGNMSAYDALKDLALNSQDKDLIFNAIKDLSIQGGAKSTNLLTEIYNSTNDTKVKEKVLDSLKDIAISQRVNTEVRKDAVSKLANLVSSENNQETKKTALDKLNDIAFKSNDSVSELAMSKLEDFAENGDENLKKLAIDSLVKVASTGDDKSKDMAISKLVDFAKVDNENLKKLAFDSLVKLASSDNQNLKKLAFDGLVKVASTGDDKSKDMAISKLVDFAKGNDENLKKLAFDSLVKVASTGDDKSKDMAISKLVDFAKGNDENLKRTAIDKLNKLASNGGVKAQQALKTIDSKLEKTINDNNTKVQEINKKIDSNTISNDEFEELSNLALLGNAEAINSLQRLANNDNFKNKVVDTFVKMAKSDDGLIKKIGFDNLSKLSNNEKTKNDVINKFTELANNNDLQTKQLAFDNLSNLAKSGNNQAKDKLTELSTLSGNDTNTVRTREMATNTLNQIQNNNQTQQTDNRTSFTEVSDKLIDDLLLKVNSESTSNDDKIKAIRELANIASNGNQRANQELQNLTTSSNQLVSQEAKQQINNIRNSSQSTSSNINNQDDNALVQRLLNDILKNENLSDIERLEKVQELGKLYRNGNQMAKAALEQVLEKGDNLVKQEASDQLDGFGNFLGLNKKAWDTISDSLAKLSVEADKIAVLLFAIADKLLKKAFSEAQFDYGFSGQNNGSIASSYKDGANSPVTDMYVNTKKMYNDSYIAWTSMSQYEAIIAGNEKEVENLSRSIRIMEENFTGMLKNLYQGSSPETDEQLKKSAEQGNGFSRFAMGLPSLAFQKIGLKVDSIEQIINEGGRNLDTDSYKKTARLANALNRGADPNNKDPDAMFYADNLNAYFASRSNEQNDNTFIQQIQNTALSRNNNQVDRNRAIRQLRDEVLTGDSERAEESLNSLKNIINDNNANQETKNMALEALADIALRGNSSIAEQSLEILKNNSINSTSQEIKDKSLNLIADLALSNRQISQKATDFLKGNDLDDDSKMKAIYYIQSQNKDKSIDLIGDISSTIKDESKKLNALTVLRNMENSGNELDRKNTIASVGEIASNNINIDKKEDINTAEQIKTKSIDDVSNILNKSENKNERKADAILSIGNIASNNITSSNNNLTQDINTANSKIKSKGIEKITEIAKTGSDSDKVKAVEQLEEIANSTDDLEIKKKALEAIKELSKDSTDNTLKDKSASVIKNIALKNEDASLRKQAIENIAQIKPKDVQSITDIALDSKSNDEVKKFAIDKIKDISKTDDKLISKSVDSIYQIASKINDKNKMVEAMDSISEIAPEEKLKKDKTINRETIDLSKEVTSTIKKSDNQDLNISRDTKLKAIDDISKFKQKEEAITAIATISSMNIESSNSSVDDLNKVNSEIKSKGIDKITEIAKTSSNSDKTKAVEELEKIANSTNDLELKKKAIEAIKELSKGSTDDNLKNKAASTIKNIALSNEDTNLRKQAIENIAQIKPENIQSITDIALDSKSNADIKKLGIEKITDVAKSSTDLDKKRAVEELEKIANSTNDLELKKQAIEKVSNISENINDINILSSIKDNINKIAETSDNDVKKIAEKAVTAIDTKLINKISEKAIQNYNTEKRLEEANKIFDIASKSNDQKLKSLAAEKLEEINKKIKEKNGVENARIIEMKQQLLQTNPAMA